MVLSAADVAPEAFQAASSVGKEHQDIEDDLQFDIRNLLVSNPHQVNEEELKSNPEKYLKSQTRAAMQCLIRRLMVLPTVPSDAGPVAMLPPKEESILPRAKPIPQPKSETKWERFAKEKGITGTKRSRMIWDEEMKEWRPRHGYKRGNAGIMNHAIVEVKPGQDPHADPWAGARQEKKARVQKNLDNRANNEGRSTAPTKVGIPVDIAPPSGGGRDGAKRGKANTKGALEMAQRSTASMGKFDEMRPAEPQHRKGQGVRRAFRPVTVGASQETQNQLKILNSVMIARAKSVDKEGTARSAKDSLVAYDAVEGPRDVGAAKRKKGRGASGKMKKLTKKRAK